MADPAARALVEWEVAVTVVERRAGLLAVARAVGAKEAAEMEVEMAVVAKVAAMEVGREAVQEVAMVAAV